MTQVLFIIVAAFLAVGGLDYVTGNRLGIGEEFERGVKSIGPLALNMVGIFILVPLLSGVILRISEPISMILGIDSSILPASMIAVDMGGFQLATAISSSEQMGLFSGVILASNLGATISFSIPVALGMIKEEDRALFLEGLVIGLIGIPFGCFVGGIAFGIEIGELTRNMLPLFVLVIIIGITIVKRPKATIKVFDKLSKAIVVVSILGLIAAGVTSVLGLPIEVLDLQEAMVIVGRIGLFLAGAYPMLKVVGKLLHKPLGKVSNKLNVNEVTIEGMIGNLASNLLVFSSFERMDDRGKVIAASFAMSGAFVFGGQLAFVSAVSSALVVPFIISKLVGGIISITVAILYLQNKEGLA